MVWQPPRGVVLGISHCVEPIFKGLFWIDCWCLRVSRPTGENVSSSYALFQLYSSLNSIEAGAESLSPLKIRRHGKHPLSLALLFFNCIEKLQKSICFRKNGGRLQKGLSRYYYFTLDVYICSGMNLGTCGTGHATVEFDAMLSNKLALTTRVRALGSGQ